MSTVTDEMVEAAVRAFIKTIWKETYVDSDELSAVVIDGAVDFPVCMRAALTAAYPLDSRDALIEQMVDALVGVNGFGANAAFDAVDAALTAARAAGYGGKGDE